MTDKEFLLKVHSDLKMLISQIETYFGIEGKFEEGFFTPSGLAYDISNVAEFALVLAYSGEEGGLKE